MADPISIPETTVTRKVTVEVTQEYIDKGCKSNADNCPVALAINKAIKDSWRSMITITYLSVYYYQEEHGGNLFMFDSRLPTEVTSFINRFDFGLPVTPFSFELELPVEALRDV